MKRIVTLSYVLMGASVALAVFLVWKYEALSRTVALQNHEILNQQSEIAENVERLKANEVVMKAQDEKILAKARVLKVSEDSLAAMQSASLYVEGGSYGNADLGAKYKELCNNATEEGSLAIFCSTHRPSIEMLALLTKALQTRIAAPQSDRYEEMRDNYQAIMDFVQPFSDSSWKASWQAIAGEGIAYANLKLGRLADAESAARRAIAANPGDGGAGVTGIKVMCEQESPKSQVKRAFTALIRRLDDRIAATDPGTLDERNARLERDLFLKDAELYSLCRYANLTRPH